MQTHHIRLPEHRADRQAPPRAQRYVPAYREFREGGRIAGFALNALTAVTRTPSSQAAQA